jgi:hypothetical protein
MDSSAYGAHSMRRTKAGQIYRKTGNLGHTKIESTVRYLGIEVDDALTQSAGVTAAADRVSYLIGLLPQTLRGSP